LNEEKIGKGKRGGGWNASFGIHTQHTASRGLLNSNIFSLLHAQGIAFQL